MPLSLAALPAAGATPTPSGPETPPEAPKQPALDQGRLRRMFQTEDDFYSAFSKPTAERIQTRLSEVPDAAAERQRIANTAFLADRFGVPGREVAENYETMRDSYARQMFKDRMGESGTMDDGVFFTNASRQMDEQEKQHEVAARMQLLLFEAAERGDTFDKAWEGLVATGEIASRKPVLDLYNAWAIDQWGQSQERVTRIRPALDSLTQIFVDARAGAPVGGLGEGAKITPRVMSEAIDLLGPLDEQDRGLVMHMALNRATQQAQQDVSGAAKLPLAISQGIYDPVTDALRSLVSTVETTVGLPEFVKDAKNRSDIRRQIESAISGEVAPLKGDTFVTDQILQFTRMTPSFLAARHPVGFGLNYLAAKQRAREALEAQGVHSGAAEATAAFHAIPEAISYYVGSHLIFRGQLPFAANPLRLTGRNLAATIGATFTAETAFNLGTEVAEEVSRVGIQNLAALVDESIPHVGMKEFIESMKGHSPDLIAQSLIGAMIGTGVATYRNAKAGQAFIQRASFMEELGFRGEDIVAVVEAKSYDQAEQAFRAGYENRTSPPPPAPPETGQPSLKVLPPETKVTVMRMGGREFVQLDVPGPEGARPLATGSPETLRAQGYEVPTLNLPAGETVSTTLGELTTPATLPGAEARARFPDAYKGPHMERVENQIPVIIREPDGTEVPGLFNGYYGPGILSVARLTPQGWSHGAIMQGKEGSAQVVTAVPPQVEPEPLPVRSNDDGTFSVRAAEGAPNVTSASPEGAAMVAEAQRIEADQQSATKPPEPRPEQDGRALPPKVTALNKAEIEALRRLFNMDELDAPARERFAQVLSEAKRTEAHRSADDIATDIIATKRVASAAEHAALVLRSAELQNAYETNAAAVAEAYLNGDEPRAAALRQTGENLLRLLDNLTEASDLAGTQIARALSIRRMRLNRDDYTLARVIQRARTAKRGELTPEQQTKLESVVAELETQKRVIEEQKAKLAEQDAALAKQKAETFVAEGRARRRKAASADAQQRRAALKRELLATGLRVNDISNVIGLSVEQARLVAKIAETYIEEGIASLTELTNKLKTDIPDLSDQDIFAAVGRQTQAEAKKIETEAKRRVKELRSQAALWAKINAALDGKRPDGSPMNKQQQNKVLRETLAQLRRQANRTVFEDAALARVDAKIREIQEHLRRGTRPAAKPAKPEEGDRLTEARQTLKELQQEMGATDTLAELERALAEAAPKPPAEGQPAEPAPTPSERQQRITGLRERIAELRDQIEQAQVDPAAVNAERLARLQRLAATLEEQIEGGFREVRQPASGIPDDSTVEAMRRQVRELEQLMRTEDSIADLEQQIRTGEFKVSAPEQRILTNARLEQALIRQKQLRRQVDELIERGRKKTAVERVVETALIPRTLLATADMSAMLRQGLLLSASRPVTASRAFVSSLRALFSQNTADAIALAIERRPGWMEGEKAGLFLSETGGSLRAAEEHFMSNFAERIPGFGRVIRASNRAMVTTLNMLRVAAFDGFVKAHPDATPEQRKAYARYVNAASGRGNVKWSPSTVKAMNAVFFAPRYAVSRFQALYSPFKNIRDPIVRNAILRDFAALLGTGLSVMALAALAGADVSFDPTDSDFGKIVVDDTRIDIWGGLAQPARLILSVPAGALRRSELADFDFEKEIDPLEAALRFMSYKVSPAISVPRAIYTGENAIGQDQEMDETLIRAITPLMLQEAFDVWEATEEAGPTAGALAAGFFGVGVQQHNN